MTIVSQTKAIKRGLAVLVSFGNNFFTRLTWSYETSA